jgi:hypothetical protein
LYAFSISPIRATCSTPLILLDLVIIISDEQYKPCSSSLYSFLQPLVASSLLSPNILLVVVVYFKITNVSWSALAWCGYRISWKSSNWLDW